MTEPKTEEELREAISEAREEIVNKAMENKEEIKEEEIQEEKEEEIGDTKEEEKGKEEEEELKEVPDEIEEEEDLSDEKAKGRAFQKIRQQKREAEERAAALSERIARLEGANEALKPKEEEDLEPDKEEDYEAHFEWRIRQQDKQIKELQANQTRSEEVTQFHQAEQAWRDIEASTKDSDYKDAKTHLVKTLKEELKEKYPAATASQINNYVRDEELKFVGALAAQGLTEEHIIASMRGLAVQKGYKAKTHTPNNDNLSKNIKKSANLADAPSAGASNETPLKHYMKQSSSDLMKSVHDPMEHHKMEKALQKARLAMAME